MRWGYECLVRVHMISRWTEVSPYVFSIVFDSLSNKGSDNGIPPQLFEVIDLTSVRFFMTLVQKSSLECQCVCEWREYHSSVCHHFPMGFWTFTAISRRCSKGTIVFHSCDVSEMSKTPLPLIAFALLAHFHTSFPFFAMFLSLVIVATLSSPANYFLALSHLLQSK